MKQYITWRMWSPSVARVQGRGGGRAGDVAGEPRGLCALQRSLDFLVLTSGAIEGLEQGVA